MENSLVTYGWNKDREGTKQLKWICDLCCLAYLYSFVSILHSLPVIIGISLILVSQKLFERKLVCFKKYFAGRGGLYEFIMLCNMQA